MKIDGYEFEVTEFAAAADAARALEHDLLSGTAIVKAEIVCFDWTGHQTFVAKLYNQKELWYL